MSKQDELDKAVKAWNEVSGRAGDKAYDKAYNEADKALKAYGEAYKVRDKVDRIYSKAKLARNKDKALDIALKAREKTLEEAWFKYEMDLKNIKGGFYE